jgi:hypothetical protein
VFSRQNEQVSVRQLINDRSQLAVLESLEGRHLRLRLVGGAESFILTPGELVEVNSSHTLYLGQVTGHEGLLLLVDVEHALDREVLEAIHEVWARPDVI